MQQRCSISLKMNVQVLLFINADSFLAQDWEEDSLGFANGRLEFHDPILQKQLLRRLPTGKRDRFLSFGSVLFINDDEESSVCVMLNPWLCLDSMLGLHWPLPWQLLCGWIGEPDTTSSAERLEIPHGHYLFFFLPEFNWNNAKTGEFCVSTETAVALVYLPKRSVIV